MRKITETRLKRIAAVLIVFVMTLSTFAIAPNSAFGNVPPAAADITLVSPPSFTGHAVFDMLDLRGIELEVTLEDGSIVTWGYSDITPDMLSWANNRDLNYRADFIANAALNNVTRTLIITADEASVEVPIAVQRYAFADGALIVLHLASGNPVNGGVGELRRNPATAGDPAVQFHVFSDITAPYVLGEDGKFPTGYDINAIFEVVHNRGDQVGYGIRTLGRNTMLDTSWDNPGWASWVWADTGRSANPDAINNAFMWRIVRLPNGYHAIQYIDHDERVLAWDDQDFPGPRTMRAVAAQDAPVTGSPTDTRVAVPRVDFANPNWWQDANIWFDVTTGGHPHDIEAYAVAVGDVVALDGDARAYSAFVPGHVEFNIPGNPVTNINFQWYRAASAAGPWVAVDGATDRMFTALSSDEGYYIRVGVHPGGYNIGTDAVFSAAFGPIEQRPELIVRSGDIESLRIIENGWLEIRWRNRMAFDTADHGANPINQAANFVVTINGTPVDVSAVSYYEWPIATPTTFMTSMRIHDWEDLWDAWQINAHNPDGFLWQSRYDYVNDPHNLFTFDPAINLWEYTGDPVDFGVQIRIADGASISRTDGVNVSTNITYNAPFVPVYQWITTYMGVDLRMSGAMSRENAIGNAERNRIILAHMLSFDLENLDGVLTAEMVRRGFNTVLTGVNENAVFLPEFRHMSSFGAIPAGGFGATIHGPNNFINAAGGLFGVNTFVHEVGHGIDGFGIAMLMGDPVWGDFFTEINRDLADIYMEIIDQGWFSAGIFSNLRSNRGEMFASMTEIWFNSRGQNDEQPTGNTALSTYHPEVWEVFSRFLTPDPLPTIPEWDAPTPSALTEPRSPRVFVPNRGSHHDFTTVGYQFGSVWAQQPEVWNQQGVRGTHPDGTPFSGQYFKLVNVLASHVITDTARDNTLGTWWDWEDTMWGGNHDGLSWIVTPVVINGQTFYNFIMKGSGSTVSYTGPHDYRFGDGSHPTLAGVFQYGGASGVYDPSVPGAGGNSMGVAPGSGVGDPIISVQHNLNDPYQLWYLVSHMGRYAQLVNKGASMNSDVSLVLSTVYYAIPDNGTQLTLTEWTMAPEIASVWRVAQIRTVPHIRLPQPGPRDWSNSLLTDFSHSVIPTFYDVKPEYVWMDIDCDRTIWIQWQVGVDNVIASNVENYLVTLGAEQFALVQEGSYSVGHLTRLMLAEPASYELRHGLGSRIRFTGVMNGANGLPVNNMLSFNFRVDDTAGSLTRAMFVEALAVLAQADINATHSAPSIFGDVAVDAWYNGVINWAADNNIVVGIGGGNFGPNQPITREAAALMLYNFARAINVQLPQQANVSFADESAISDWAFDAVSVMHSFFGLVDGLFAPHGTLASADVAAIFEAFAQIMQ